MMRRILLIAVTATSSIGSAGMTHLFGQTHKVAKPEDVVRAVGVYEWTGDEAKPNASRLIPVTVFIDGALEDAGVYLARPVPLAINSGTVYEVDKAGIPEGTLDVRYASRLQSSDSAANYDDGWFGYGTFVPPPAPKKASALKESKTLSPVISSKPDAETDRPTFGLNKKDSSAKEKADSPKVAEVPAGGAAQPPNDPDRPHLSKKPDSSSTPDQTTAEVSVEKVPSAPAARPAPANDPDRPTLKKRSPEEAKKARKEAEQSSATGLATSLNEDPNRPTLHRGRGVEALSEADLPKLKGVPAGIHQAVAVSDAKTRPLHDFSKPWADDAERASVLAKMQTIAKTQIAAYKQAPSIALPPRPTKRSPNSKMRLSNSKESAGPEIVLEGGELRGYTLSYGGAATYVYTAHTLGEGADLRYVTVVAQMDAFGQLQPAVQSVTDAAHLDRTPWMRLIDVVDFDASNRASLLFEMRSQSARQFAMYRVIAARAEQVFLTGTTQ